MVRVRTDEEIHQDVLDELDWDPEVDAKDVGVTVHDGVVTLTGTVDSFLKKWAAERAALRVEGVRAVVNHIEVVPRGLVYGRTRTSPGRWRQRWKRTRRFRTSGSRSGSRKAG
jgi:hypothetical protein